MIDIESIREDTPNCENIIHFNNAGCSLMPGIVSSQLFKYLHQEQEIGGYETEKKWRDQLNQFYSSAAKLISCNSDEISFCESNTRGWQQFFYSVDLSPGDTIITTRGDYGSNIVAYIQAKKHKGVNVEFIETDDNGDLDLTHLESLINESTKLISVSHIPTACGIVNSAEKIGEIAAKYNVPYLLDACQSVGHVHIDVKKIRCTALTTTGRKYLRGPRGTGFLFVSRDYFENAQPANLEQQSVKLYSDDSYDLLDSARRFENFECHFAGKLALKEAMDYAIGIGTESIQARILEISKFCREQLSEISGVTVHDQGAIQCGIVTFSIEGQSPAITREQLSKHGINIWISIGSGSLVDFQHRGLESVARASLHYYNTVEEVEKFCEVVRSIV